MVTEEVDVMVTGEVDVMAAGEVDVMAAGEVDIMGTGEVGVMVTRELNIFWSMGMEEPVITVLKAAESHSVYHLQEKLVIEFP